MADAHDNPYKSPLECAEGDRNSAEGTPLLAWLAFACSLPAPVALLFVAIVTNLGIGPPVPWRVDTVPGVFLCGILFFAPLGVLLAATSLRRRASRVGYYSLLLGVLGTLVLVLAIW
jgi:hypothetical protein